MVTARYFAAPIKGDGLIGENIESGDMAIIKETAELSELSPDYLLVVLTPLGILVKHAYFSLSGEVRLVSANPEYPDLVFKSSAVKIIGRVVAVEKPKKGKRDDYHTYTCVDCPIWGKAS